MIYGIRHTMTIVNYDDDDDDDKDIDEIELALNYLIIDSIFNNDGLVPLVFSVSRHYDNCYYSNRQN